MRHDWHPDDSLATSAAARYFMRHRVCRKCGAKQSYEDISYDVMATPKLKQAWRPLVGRCTLAKRIAKKHNVPDQTPAALDSANTTDASSLLSASVLLGVGGIGEDWQEKVKELASAETAHRISWHHLEEFIREALVEELRLLKDHPVKEHIK